MYIYCTQIRPECLRYMMIIQAFRLQILQEKYYVQQQTLQSNIISEQRHEKTNILHMRKQRCRTAQLISPFVFAIWLVQFLYYLYPKFQASSHLLWLYSLVCVRPGRKPRRPVFSQRGSYLFYCFFQLKLLQYKNSYVKKRV